jgi:AcrR family transcriptional regulator
MGLVGVEDDAFPAKMRSSILSGLVCLSQLDAWMDLMKDVVPCKQTRRRGAALDVALLSAAWEELLENGYEHLTLESVAERAHTSRPVIARRWNDRRTLVLAALRHWFEQNPIAAPDTGSLRGDLLAYLENKSATSTNRVELLVVFRLRIEAFMTEAGTSPAQLFEQIGQGLTGGLDEIWERASQRGEVDSKTLTPRIRLLPFDLVSMELSRTHQPVSRTTIEEILDTIVLPLTAVEAGGQR